jgi:hypothetical protein
MDCSSQRLVSGICSAGIVLFCESEYACLRLFKQKTTLFFFVCQLAIWSSAVVTALSISVYFLPNLRVLPMLVIISINGFLQYVSYPIMILLRLRLVCDFSVIIMYIPVVLSAILAVLRFFWMRWLLTGGGYYFNAFFITQVVTIILCAVQTITINIFFIVMAIKRFENVVHIRSIVIVNIAVIILECALVLIGFLIIDTWIVFCVIAIVFQIKARLEIETLSCIVQSVRERRDRSK